MTILEVVLAVLLLSLVAASVMGAISSINQMQFNNRERLAAFEVANRLILQYLDDPTEMPRDSLAIDYGQYKFFWKLDETTAAMEINPKHQTSGGASLNALDRFRVVAITVFESKQSGEFPVAGEPIASMTRMIDPFTPRNADSMDALGRDPEKLRRWLNPLLGNQQQRKSR